MREVVPEPGSAIADWSSALLSARPRSLWTNVSCGLTLTSQGNSKSEAVFILECVLCARRGARHLRR